MLSFVRRLAVTVLILAALGFLAYATLGSHAQRPCLEYTVGAKTECLVR
jgi:hypothetical protein